ncbi:septal ring lytic transglycosylase RlpA family protein, partial [Lutimaribacter sp. EGI FJ00014]|nr:septal ring lytic transglycosylase RlpA family protein [Lutimaribacter sp. EGI FJ00014]
MRSFPGRDGALALAAAAPFALLPAAAHAQCGSASWYALTSKTASGERMNPAAMTAAHRKLPFGTKVKVVNQNNGKAVTVRINDRGPFAEGRVIDLSKRAAEMLDYTHSGVAKVRVEYVGPAPLHGQDESYLMASYRPGDRAPDPSDGLPSGVMIAMNGPTPS